MGVKKRKKAKPLLYVLVAIVILVIGFILCWFISISAVDSKDHKQIEVVIPSGANAVQIASILKHEDLIRSEFLFKVYIKLNKINSLKASTYNFSRNMDLKEIVSVLEKGNNYNPNVIRLTFREGERISDYIKVIVTYTNNTYDDVKTVMYDKVYIKSLINKYWFLTDKILQDGIFYPLEGYLAPNTYEFINKDVDVKTIIERMLDETNKNLQQYKNSKKVIHYVMTMASICELEGTNLANKKEIVGVFENRLAKHMNLGSDVTTYYALQLPMTSDLTDKQFNCVSPYNTRHPNMVGKMPIGPISNPSLESIEASFKPSKNNYEYFVADRHGKIYFNKTYPQHLATIKEIKDKGDWIQW